MTEVMATFHEALRVFVQGNGVQYLAGLETAFDGVPVQAGRIDAPSASLDFVVAGPAWWTAENPIELAREWRRCLKEGGRLAVVVDAAAGSQVAIMRLLATECGLQMEKPIAIEGGSCVLTGVRSLECTLRSGFSNIGFEIARTDRPASWKAEFWFDVASVLLQAGDGRRAAECFGAAIAEDPDSLEARVGLAMSMAVTAEWDEAETILGEVLRVDPEHGLAAQWLRRCRARHAEEHGDPSVLTPASRRPPKGL